MSYYRYDVRAIDSQGESQRVILWGFTIREIRFKLMMRKWEYVRTMSRKIVEYPKNARQMWSSALSSLRVDGRRRRR